ncbi:PREDICTED: cytochrome P450 71B23-like [Tarenaya hassleriana]|uniref:cytochrome P450 71B23-like n=1 Tax=Tarenaya hassleriana TaxID=28532 RepID=UPI00053CA47D|nr:PREDICTED: cytochrome P450 71B23-like [Tarenaya hassleriana]
MAIFMSFLCLLLLTLVSLILVKKGKTPKRNLPPSPRKLPVIGNLHQLKGKPHRYFHQLSKKFGPVMLFRFGFTPVVVISSREAAEQVLKTHDLVCCSRPMTVGINKFTRQGKVISFAPYGEEWRELRKIAVLEFFSPKKVRSFRHIREEENNLLVKKLSESALKQSPVDLSITLFRLAAGIILRVAFGQNILESKLIDKDKIGQIMEEAQDVQASSFSDFFPGFGWLVDWFSGKYKKLDKVCKEFDNFFQEVIDDHLKHGRTDQDHPDFVDAVLKIMEEQGEDEYFRLNTDHIKGIFSDIVVGGIDTSAITMTWAMTELARNPRAMRKAQEEIRNCIGKKETITEDDLDRIHYLKLVIKETLRLHPAAPLLLPRLTTGPVQIQGYDIPPRTWLQVNAYAIARDPENWENPDEFIPERFIDRPADYRGQHFELLPFGSGRRTCPGISMAIATVELALLNLLYFFDWELPDWMTEKDIDIEETGKLTTGKKEPLKLVPVRHV